MGFSRRLQSIDTPLEAAGGRRQRHRQQGGFALIELVFAMMVLVLGFLPVFAMFILSQRICTQSQIEAVAYNVARNEIEDLQLQSFSNSPTGTETTFTIPATVSGQLPGGVVLTGTYLINTPSGSTSTTLREVSVLVRWRNALTNSGTAGPNSEVRVSTLIAQQPSE